MLLHRRFDTKEQHDIRACYCSIFTQLHLQNRGTEQKPNIWFIPVPDLQIPKLILLSPTYVVLINFAQSSLI